MQAHREWGRRESRTAVTELNGMFAYALWDSTKRELLLVRDRLGIKRLYYYLTEHGVLFGSEPKAILLNSLAERTMDADGLRRTLCQVADQSNTVFRGMREVPLGHIVRVTGEGIQQMTYWQLTTAGTPTTCLPLFGAPRTPRGHHPEAADCRCALVHSPVGRASLVGPDRTGRALRQRTDPAPSTSLATPTTLLQGRCAPHPTALRAGGCEVRWYRPHGHHIICGRAHGPERLPRRAVPQSTCRSARPDRARVRRSARTSHA